MAPGSGRGVPLGAPWQGGAVAALLIVALLLCHGVMGFAHQTSAFHSHGPADVSGGARAHHGPTTDAAGTGGVDHAPPIHDAPGGASSGPSDTAYFAALVALSGTVLLALLFVAFRGRAVAAIRGSIYRSPRPPAIAPRARGPSPPLLQAFRL